MNSATTIDSLLNRSRLVLRRPGARYIVLAAWIALPTLAMALALVINLRKPWEFDESYNLQVVENLRHGFGYSSNGAFRGVGPYEFDPYVSTGPAVLVPIWILSELIRSTFVAARIVMFLYLALLIVGLRKFLPAGQRGWFQFGLVLMALTPVVAATNPLFVLGEIPAMALAVMSVVAISRNRDMSAGLLAGGVILCKLNFVFAAGTLVLIALTVIAFESGAGRREVIRRLLRLILGAALLPAVFEVYRLVSLGGLTAYRTNISELRQFIDTQRLDHWTQATELLGRKLTLLFSIPGSGVWLVLGVSVIFVLLLSISRHHSTIDRHSGSPGPVALLLPAGLVVGTFLFMSSVWFVRQGASALYLLIPVPVITATDRGLNLCSGEGRRGRVAGIGLIGVVSAVLFVNVVGEIGKATEYISSDGFSSAYDEQTHVAAVIRDSGATSIVLDGWFQNPDLQLLSGVPAASMPGVDARPIIVISAVKYFFGGSGGSLQAERERCREVLYETDQVLVCWPKVP